MPIHRIIAVAEWEDTQNPVIHVGRAHRRFWPPAIIGLAGTLLLHSLVFQTVLMGGRAHRLPPPEVPEPGASTKISKTTPAEALVFIDLHNPTALDNGIAEALASARAAIKENPIVASRVDLSPVLDAKVLASEDEVSDTSVDTGDGAERARLFGIYSGQIQARVDRIWSRPRTPVNDASDPATGANSIEYFRCQVQIVQDSRGNVQEILLPDCNGSAAWQRSLVLALQGASPLPAPPSPTVFSRTVSLIFVGYAYVAGGSSEGYEAQQDMLARASADSVRRPSSAVDIGHQ
jgi:hypothetical protein